MFCSVSDGGRSYAAAGADDRSKAKPGRRFRRQMGLTKEDRDDNC